MSLHKRNTFIINSKLQLRFSVLVVALFLVGSILYPIMINDLLVDTTKILKQVNAPDSIINNYKGHRSELLFILISWQIGFSALIFIVCIFFSHRIAGPIFKLQKFLYHIQDGQPRNRLFFRKGDYFHDLADDINETFSQIEEEYKNNFVYISEVNTYLKNLEMVVPEDKRAVLDEISSRLHEIQTRFNESEEVL